MTDDMRRYMAEASPGAPTVNLDSTIPDNVVIEEREECLFGAFRWAADKTDDALSKWAVYSLSEFRDAHTDEDNWEDYVLKHTDLPVETRVTLAKEIRALVEKTADLCGDISLKRRRIGDRNVMTELHVRGVSYVDLWAEYGGRCGGGIDGVDDDEGILPGDTLLARMDLEGYDSDQ